jgi:hypothetical protein
VILVEKVTVWSAMKLQAQDLYLQRVSTHPKESKIQEDHIKFQRRKHPREVNTTKERPVAILNLFLKIQTKSIEI